MTLEYLNEQKAKYQERQRYFATFEFERIAGDFQGVVDLIEEMEKYVKKKEGEKN